VLILNIGVHMDTELFLRSDDSRPAQYRWEKEANHFAAELLMPQDSLLDEFSKISGDSKYFEKAISELSKKFEVSEIAMYYRMKNLNIQAGL
jgi:Zn-dependent peptidase ImmA (M78 family)